MSLGFRSGQGPFVSAPRDTALGEVSWGANGITAYQQKGWHVDPKAEVLLETVNWETVYEVAAGPDSPRELTYRTKVTGGWLYRHVCVLAKGALVGSMCFVPNPLYAVPGEKK